MVSIGVLIIQFGKAQTTIKSNPSTFVTPINWNKFQKKSPHTEIANNIKATLLNANKYALSTWFHTVKNYQLDSSGYLDLKSKSKVKHTRCA